MEAIPSYFIYELSIGRPKQVGLEVVLVVAPAAERLLKLVHVDPEIRRVLGALAHRHRLVVRALIRLEGVVRHDRRPHDRRPLARRHRDVQPREARLAAVLDGREVQEERVQPRAPRREARRVLRTRRRVFFSTCGPGLGRGR